MKTKHLLAILATAAAAIPLATFAADHTDAPGATAAPEADVLDLHAWMSSDANNVILSMTVQPFAMATTEFSDAVQYVFHVNSSAGYGMAQTETNIICEFDDAQVASCWVGAEEFVTGDASDTAGITNDSGSVKVFAGLRNDPFFFDLTGFNNAVGAVIQAAPGLEMDAEGCPMVDQTTSDTVVGLLGANGDTLAGANALAIVVEVDKTLLTGGGDTLGVWASTHTK